MNLAANIQDKEIYGNSSIGSNLQNLGHVFEDVQKFVSLIYTSTYPNPFENRLQFLKSRIRQQNLPLQQITRRLIELTQDTDQLCTSSSKKPSFPQLRLPFKLNSELVYKDLQIDSGCTISTTEKANSYFLTVCSDIVLMKYAVSRGNEIIVYGSPINTKNIFFTQPISSKIL